MLVVACTAALLGLSGVPAAAAPSAATAPLTALTQAQTQLTALETGGDARAREVLANAVTELGASTAQSLWVDASDVVPPPEGDAVFAAAAAAIRDVASITGDRSVSSLALRAVDDEILSACGELARGALSAAGLPDFPVLPFGSVGSAQAEWDHAFARHGAQITAEIASVSQGAVDAGAEASLHSPNDGLENLPSQLVAMPLTSDGKPDVFYYGAEACPYCAADRWSIALALAQFGTFAPLALSDSATFDIDPATNTLTFYESSYFSPYVSFSPDEAYTNQPGTAPSCGFPPWGALQAASTSEQQILGEFDSIVGCQDFPFLDVANEWATVGSYPDPTVLQGMSWNQIAGSLSAPGSAAGDEIDGGAEMIAAQICAADGERPLRVCGDPVNRQYQQLLATAPTNLDGANELGGVSCPSSALCVAVGTTGTVVASDDPGAATPTWSQPEDDDAMNTLGGVSCPTISLCVAVDYDGSALISHDPDARVPTWSVPAQIDPQTPLVSVSCATANLCVAVDAIGDALVTHNPSAPTPTWSAPVSIDANTELVSVSCPSVSLCLSVDAAGNALATDDPAASAPTWSAPEPIDSQSYLYSVSCPSATLCVATDGAGNFLETDDPAAPTPNWTAPVNIDGASPLSIACYATAFCVAVDSQGNVLETHDPDALPPTWSAPDTIEPDGLFLAIACPSTSLCVATSALGTIYETHNPDAAAPTWSGRANSA